jgi:hypothetical protein
MIKFLFLFFSISIALALSVWGFNLKQTSGIFSATSKTNNAPELIVNSYFQREGDSSFLALDYIADTNKNIVINQVSMGSDCYFKLNIKLEHFINLTKKMKLPSHCENEKPVISFSIDGHLAKKNKLKHHHNQTVLTRTPRFIMNSEYTFSSGHHSIDKEWIFGEQSTVTFADNAHLSFKEGASFSINGRVNFPKLKANQVTFSGEKWGGILIRTKLETVISNLVIQGGQDLNSEHRSTSGSLNIQNSNSVTLKNIIVRNSKASDAIHIKDSTVFIKNLEVYNSAGDGIDFDRASGIVEDIIVINSGADAIDFYHSNLELINVEAKGCKDKGLSIGERSTIVAKNITISNCRAGITLKDESRLNISNKKLFDNEINIERFITDVLYSSPGIINESI